jgi:D-3-phosphoglycerate dehydrogenase
MKSIIYLGPSDGLTTVQGMFEPRWQVIAPALTAQAVGETLGNAVAILDASMRVHFDRSLLELAPGLRVVSTATTGVDHIDAGFLAKRRIPLLSLAGEREFLQTLTPAAEHSWLLLMACARRLRGAVQHVLDGKWRREEFPGIMLRGKTLGLVGCGRIGTWVSRYARAFQMDVLGYDPYVPAWPVEIVKSDIDTLLATSDFVSIHVPLNSETRGMLGKREFALMKNKAILINTSRGSILDESALLTSLKKGCLAAAGLDVLDGEPAIHDHPLLEYARQHDNLILTPHIGGFCPDAVKAAVTHAAQRIALVLDNAGDAL